jgi:hypothetical protein
MSDGLPYTRKELQALPDGFPERGPICPRCRTRIPQFAELSSSDEFRIKSLISNGQKLLAMAELEAATGCPKRFAKIWVLHSGRPDSVGTSAPCPYCGGALVTALARQCKHCFMDWHDPENPYNLKTKEKANKARHPTEWADVSNLPFSNSNLNSAFNAPPRPSGGCA